jgi:hypothetical protein
MPIDFQQIELNGSQTNRAYISWSAGSGGATGSFEVQYLVGRGSFSPLTETRNTAITVDGIDPGRRIQVKVRAVGVGFPVRRSSFATASAIAPALGTNQPIAPIPDTPSTGTTIAPPEDVRNVRFQRLTSTTGILQWDRPVVRSQTDLIVDIRHSSATDGTGTINNSTSYARVPASSDTLTISVVNGEYLLRFQDRVTNLFSDNAVSVVVNLVDTEPRLLVEERREDTTTPPFVGASRRGVFYSSEYDGLVLDGDETIDQVTSIDDLSTIDFFGTRLLTGEYDFPNLLDLGGKFEVQLERILVSRSLYPSDLIDDRSSLVDSWPDWDGTRTAETTTELYFRASDEAVANFNVALEEAGDTVTLEDGDVLQQESTLGFGNFAVLRHGTFVGRTFQFKARLETNAVDQTPLVDRLGYRFYIPSRTESSGTIASGAGAKAVTFTNAFYQAPTVGVTAFNLASGDYYEVTSVTRTGFTVHFKDSSNSSVDRNFQYVANGFGSEQT